jgi:hypothetical protein
VFTEAEEVFERICTEHGISCRRIPPTDSKTPDYELLLASGPVLVEVKQLEPNAGDIAYHHELRTKGQASRMVDMGRARLAISSAMKQLSPHAKGKMPAVVVLYDTMGTSNYLDPYSLAFALYGPEKIHFAVPNDPRLKPQTLGMSRGGDAVATPTQNTTLSAVAVLDGPAQGVVPSLRIFHNCNARIPLPPNAFEGYPFREFDFAPPAPGRMPEWIERSAATHD